jgi:tetratricopeptide (TPR) repeat protein
VRDACDEVLKIDPKCVKAYYRKAKSYMDDPKSLISEHIEAQKILEIANKIDPNNVEISNTLEKFSKQLNDEKKNEQKKYKSYYNKIIKRQRMPRKKRKKKKRRIKKRAIVD